MLHTRLLHLIERSNTWHEGRTVQNHLFVDQTKPRQELSRFWILCMY
jgi:hypothetical protein